MGLSTSWVVETNWPLASFIPLWRPSSALELPLLNACRRAPRDVVTGMVVVIPLTVAVTGPVIGPEISSNVGLVLLAPLESSRPTTGRRHRPGYPLPDRTVRAHRFRC